MEYSNKRSKMNTSNWWKCDTKSYTCEQSNDPTQYEDMKECQKNCNYFTRFPNTITNDIFKNYTPMETLIALEKSGKYLKESKALSNTLNKMKISSLLKISSDNNIILSSDKIAIIHNLLDKIIPNSNIDQYQSQSPFLMDMFTDTIKQYILIEEEIDKYEEYDYVYASTHPPQYFTMWNDKLKNFNLILAKLWQLLHELSSILITRADVGTFYQSRFDDYIEDIPAASVKYQILNLYFSMLSQYVDANVDFEDEELNLNLNQSTETIKIENRNLIKDLIHKNSYIAWNSAIDTMKKIKEFKNINFDIIIEIGTNDEEEQKDPKDHKDKIPDTIKQNIVNLFIDIVKSVIKTNTIDTHNFEQVFDFISFLVEFGINFGNLKLLQHDISHTISNLLITILKYIYPTSPQNINLYLHKIAPIIEIKNNYLAWKKFIPSEFFQTSPSLGKHLNFSKIRNQNNKFWSNLLIDLLNTSPKTFKKLMGPSISLEEVIELLWKDDPKLKLFLISIGATKKFTIFQSGGDNDSDDDE